ncbi:MAG: 3-hydroxyacyl-CoA dehydrogenase/enoyl-CoA hydratase family protein [Thermodesulfobacteriota bacterium]
MMNSRNKLYPTSVNPLLIQHVDPLPKEIAVIGAGTIGPDIGYYLKSALPDIILHLVDIAQEPLEKARKRISGYAEKAVERKKMKPEKADAITRNIFYTTDYNQIKNCTLVIEAATENIPLKHKIFEAVEDRVSETAIITSNTSSIPAQRLFAKMKRPERATVTHFFAPAWRSLPVEVINWSKVSRKTLDYLFGLFGKTGKVPIITADAICFMLDRIFDNWCNESAYLLEKATASQIDKVAEEFVFAGPFFVLNLANGNPIIIETNSLQMEEGAHYRPASILASVDRWKTHKPGGDIKIPHELKQTIRDRLLGILFSQSFDIIDRGIGTPEDLNFGCQVALGFKKGPLDIMKSLGENEVNRIMNRFKRERSGFPHASKPFTDYQSFHRHLLVDDIQGVRILTLRRPQALNALNDRIMDEILELLTVGSHDPMVKGFLLTGYGTTAFSAGGEIGRFPEMLGNKNASVQYAKECAKVQIFMDQMEKPVVAAVNGLALGGGLELAIRCHAMVALDRAGFQFPEITLGILPGIGGCIIPYRKWPEGASRFHEMILFGKMLSIKEAVEIKMVDATASTYPQMIQEGIRLVSRLTGKIPRIPEEAASIPGIEIPDPPMAGKLQLSKEAVTIAWKTILEGAACNRLSEALEKGYLGFGEIACTSAAREGISAFLEKRKPTYLK